MKTVTADVFPISAISTDEAKDFINWAYLMRLKTKFTPEVLRHPRMCMTRASYDGKPGLYIPVQPVLMMDALTPDPSLSAMQRAIGMYRIGELLEHSIMPNTGIWDAYATVTDDAEADSMAKHGWQEIKDVRLMRKRITAPIADETQ